MVKLDLSWIWMFWAELLQLSINIKHCGHLFVPVSSKQHRFHSFLQIQVRFRISFFSNPCYVSNRSLHADCYATWIMKNEWVLSEISGNEVWCSMLILLDACYSVWFDAIGWWICVVWSLFALLVCLLLISGQVVFHDLMMLNTAAVLKPLNLPRKFPWTVFGLFLFDVTW